jgi:hypothetical protein
MDKHTVLIPLEEYENLREIKVAESEGKIVCKIQEPNDWGQSVVSYDFFTNDELVKHLADRMQRLNDRFNEALCEKNEMFSNSVSKDKIREMSFWELLRYKRELNK